MSKYSFLIHGDDGEYEQLNDKLRIRKYGAWLIVEKIQQDKLAKQQARQVLAAVQLAKRISKAEDISIEEAFSRLQNQEEGDNAILLSGYLDEAKDIVEGGMSRNEQDSKLITIFMKTRAEGLIKGTWKALGDWAESDTQMLDENLRDKVFKFIMSEQSGGDEIEGDEDDAIEEQDDAEGKSLNGTEQSETASKPLNEETNGTPATQESPLPV